MNLTVETSCTEQCLVEHIYTVGGCQYDNAAVCTESVHLCEQRIQRILAFVVASHRWILRASTPYCIYLVDEYNRRCFLFGLSERIANTACTYTHEHFDKVGTTHREERSTRFACYCLCQQRLTCSRRTYKQCALWYLATQLGVFLRVLQELYNLLYFLLCAFLTSYVFKGNAYFATLFVYLGFRFAYAEHTAATACATVHTSH